MHIEKPPVGTPEFDEWLLEKLRKRAEELFNADIPEECHDVGVGRSVGPEKASDLMPEKTVAEDISIDKEQRLSKFKVVK